MRRFCSIAIIVFALPAPAQRLPTDTPAPDLPLLFNKSRTHMSIGASYLDPPCLTNELSAWDGLCNLSILRFDRKLHFSMDPITDNEKEPKVWDEGWLNLQPKKKMKWPLELDPQQHPIPETTPGKPKPVITPCTNPQGHAIPECNPQPQPKPKPKSNPCIDVHGHAIPECSPQPKPKPKPKRDVDPTDRATSGLEVDLNLGHPSPPVRICHSVGNDNPLFAVVRPWATYSFGPLDASLFRKSGPKKMPTTTAVVFDWPSHGRVKVLNDPTSPP